MHLLLVLLVLFDCVLELLRRLLARRPKHERLHLGFVRALLLHDNIESNILLLHARLDEREERRVQEQLAARLVTRNNAALLGRVVAVKPEIRHAEDSPGASDKLVQLEAVNLKQARLGFFL